jgi:hypothetical protein
MKYLHLAIWIAVTSPFVIDSAHAQSSQAGQEAIERPDTAFERALATTAAVVKGVKVTLNSVGFKRGESLGMELNLHDITQRAPLECRSKDRPYSFRDSRNIALFASLAPADSTDARLGDWKIGATWVVYDETSLFREDALQKLQQAANKLDERYFEIIRKAGNVEQQETLWATLQEGTRATLAAVFDRECKSADPSFSKDDWDSENPNLTQLLQAANDACRAANQTKISEARANLIEAELDELGKWSKTLQCEQEAVPISLRFKVLESQRDLWTRTWNTLCEPLRQETLRTIYEDMKQVKRDLASGLIVSLQAAGIGHAEVLVPAGDGDIATIKRNYLGEGALQVSYRWLGKNVSLDATAKVIRTIPFDDRDSTLTHTAALNIELWPRRINGSSVIVGMDVGGNELFAGGTERDYFVQGRLSLPLHEQVFLLFSLRREKDDGNTSVRDPSFALAWSYEQSGKELMRRIELVE